MSSILTDAGVEVLSEREVAQAERPAFLEMELGVTTLEAGDRRLGWAYFLNLQLLQQLCPAGQPSPSECSLVPTWGVRSSQPAIVPARLAETVYSQLAEALSRFIDDYVGANPSAQALEVGLGP